MSSAPINDRISDYSLSAHRLHSFSLAMGCASSQGSNIPMNSGPGSGAGSDKSAGDAGPAGASAKYPPAEAFEISLDDVDNDDNDDRSDSLIKKHPPKRLQKLVEQAATAVTPTTIEDLEEKLAKAEVRRQQYIQQRIDNIISVTGKGAGASNDGSNGSGDGDGDGDGDGGADGGEAADDGEGVVVKAADVLPQSGIAGSANNGNDDSQKRM